MLHKLLLVVLIFGMLLTPQSSTDAAKGDDVFNLRIDQGDSLEIVLDFWVRDYRLDTVHLDGSDYTSIIIDAEAEQAGVASYEMPVLTKVLVVPPGGGYSIDYQVYGSKQVSGVSALLPVLRPAELQEDLTPGTMLRAAQPGEQLAGFQPVEIVQVEEAWVREYRLLTIKVFPFQYDASQKSLIASSHVQVKLGFEAKWAPANQIALSATEMQSDPFLPGLRQVVENPEMFAAWRAAPGIKPVATSAIQNILAAPRYRIAIEQDGLYRMTYSELLAAGLPVASIDPQTFQLDSQGRQVALFVSDNDGNPAVFSPGEYLAFYGQSFRGDRLAQRFSGENAHFFTYWKQLTDGTQVLWKPEMNAEMFEKYTHTNVYWLSYNQSNPLRMLTLNGAPGSAPVPDHYTAVVRAEQDRYWRTAHFTSEDTFFWEDSGTPLRTALSFATQLDALASGTFTATLKGEVVAMTSNLSAGPDHRTQFFVNDPTFAGAPLVDRYWEGRSALAFEADFPQTRLLEGANQLNMKIIPTAAVPNERLLINWFEIHYAREFQANNNALEFSMALDGPWKYQISGYSNGDLGVMDISAVYTPTWITGSQFSSGILSFESSQPAGARYFAGKFNDLSAAQIEFTSLPDLATPADYVIITHKDFLPAVQPLADYRASKGLDVKVLDQQALYNAFTDGIFHPLAVKEFLRYAFANWSKPPLYVLLVGDGHWNFHGSPIYASTSNYFPPNLSWVDPWQGEVDSSSLLANVVGTDILPDVMIARLPVNNIQEIANYTNKVINYEAQGVLPWQRNLLYVADNIPDLTGDFVYFSNAIAAEYQRPGFISTKIYENDYGCPTVTGNLCPQVNYAITSTLSSSGAMLVSFIGHASLDRWTHEHIFLNRSRTFPAMTLASSISTMNNPDRLPVILSMTCLDGYWIYPDNISDPARSIGPQSSIIEDLQRVGGKGSVGAFSPTGLGVATGHDSLERGFLDSLFIEGDWRLGAAAQSAKMRLFLTGSNFDLLNTFTIFGDPALQLRSPHAVSVTPTTADLAAPAGGSVVYGLQVKNTGEVTDTFDITLGVSAWPVDAPAQLGPLAPGESVGINVMVQIPFGMPPGSSDSVQVTVTSRGNYTRASSSVLTTQANEYLASWQPPTLQKTSSPGSQVVYDLELVNSGFSVDSYSLSISGNSWTSVILTDTTLQNVFPGASRTVRVGVTLPASISGIEHDSMVISAQSLGDPTVNAQAELITTAAYQTFLPVIVR
jgi:hypothetical protein